MAGSNDSFDPAAFRDAIEFAMTMGTPNTVEDRPTFHFAATKEYADRTTGAPVIDPVIDQDGNPLDPNVRVVKVTPPPVQIPCAVEFTVASPEERPVGSFKSTKASITVLDTHYPQVEDAIEVALGEDMYAIAYERPSNGLFDVDVHTLECFAIAET